MTFNDKIEQLDKELRKLRAELEKDLFRYKNINWLRGYK